MASAPHLLPIPSIEFFNKEVVPSDYLESLCQIHKSLGWHADPDFICDYFKTLSTFVAHDVEGQIFGYLQMHIGTDAICINTLGIDPKFQSLGIDYALFESALNKSVHLGLKHLIWKIRTFEDPMGQFSCHFMQSHKTFWKTEIFESENHPHLPKLTIHMTLKEPLRHPRGGAGR